MTNAANNTPLLTRKAGQYLVLAYLLSWTIATVFIALGGEWNTTSAIAVAVAYMFMPLVAAVTVQRLHGNPVRDLGISPRPNRWYLAAWLLPPIIAFATVGTSLLMPGVEYAPGLEGLFERLSASLTPEQMEALRQQVAASPIHPVWLALIQGLVAGATVNAVAGFGEELGWRGLLYHETRHLGFWRSSALVGIVWGTWHAPLILQGHNYPQHPVPGVLMMALFTLLLSPLFTLIRDRSGSTVAAAILHGTINATLGIPLFLVRGGNDLTVGGTGTAGLLTLAILNVGIYLYGRRTGKLDLSTESATRTPGRTGRTGTPPPESKATR